METPKITLETLVRDFIRPILHEVLNEELKNLATINSPAAEVRELGILRHKEYLSGKEVQALFGLNHKTLADWRSQGRGPAFTQDGYVILYRRLDVEAYLKSAKRRTIDQKGQTHCTEK
jgi:hypothetical protein